MEIPVWLADSGWMAVWATLAAGSVPVIVGAVGENRARKRVLEDIEIYEKWSSLDDPASVETCRMHVNRTLAKLYLPGVRKVDVFEIIVCIFFIPFCLYQLSSGDSLSWLWFVMFVVYIIGIVSSIWSIAKARKNRDAKSVHSDRITRLYDEECLLESMCLSVLNDKSRDKDVREKAEELRHEVVGTLSDIEDVAKDANVLDFIELLPARAKQRNKLRGYEVE